MEAQYWLDKWADEKIGFHQSEFNQRLITYWPQVSDLTAQDPSAVSSCVFVPLCGKSLDLLWLHQQGHEVLGIELSVIAVEAFFDENDLSYERVDDDQFSRFSGTGSAHGITLLAGDFFGLTPSHVASCNLFYDRASLIAMNPEMRAAYAHHLATLLPPGAQGLLLAISYDQDRMKGPPFSVSDENARQLLGDGFDIIELALFAGPERVGNLRDRGLETLDERVYLLKRR